MSLGSSGVDRLGSDVAQSRDELEAITLVVS
jgi:hypothetical protein